MKKGRKPKHSGQSREEMLPEYQFDYRKAKPNRFASRFKSGSRVVILDPDIAAVFPTPQSVNAVLRALIQTMPQKSPQ